MEIIEKRLFGFNIKNTKILCNSIRVFATTKNHTKLCNYCYSENVQLHGNSQIRLADLPYQDKKVMIFVTRKRFKCLSCSKTFQESIPHQSDRTRMTTSLVSFIDPRPGSW